MVENGGPLLGDETQVAPASVVTSDDAFSETMAVDTGADDIQAQLRALDAEEFARYEQGKTIGRGGMGEVRSWLDRRIGREVATKTMRQGSEALGRFVREARVQGQLEHPSIVPVYDLATMPSGDVFFTMKRLRGDTLRDILGGLRRGDSEHSERFTPARLLSAFLDVCQAIAFAHSKGVLHRDLKPANIMLGDFGEVYVLDWGVARVAGESPARESAETGPGELAVDGELSASIVTDSNASEATEAGAVLGTLGYMPAEQLAGAEVDARADVYALGCILFELLTFESFVERTSRGEVVAQTLSGVDPRPRLDAAQVAPELIEAVFRATRPDKNERHASVGSLHEDIAAFLEGDRDLARRRELALVHVELAREHLSRGEDELEARAAAIREAAHAVALDPECLPATELMSRLLMEPPKETPDEVEAELFAAAEAGGREQAKTAAVSYTAWFSFVGLILWMGLRDGVTLGAFVLGVVGVITASVVLYKSERLTGNKVMFAVYANIFLVSAATRVFGPFILAPGLVASASMLFLMHPLLGGRHVPITLSAMASLLVPWGLEKAGILQASYAFEGDSIRILANMAEFNALPAEILLVLTAVGPIAIAGAVAAQIRNSLDEANRRLAIQAWQLRRALPAEG